MAKIFDSVTHKGETLWRVNQTPSNGTFYLQGHDTRFAINRLLFSSEELDELLQLAKDQNEPAELIEHIEQVIASS